jgi:acetyl-CoA acetyltransferase
MSTAAHLFGQWARRHMALYGTTSAQMGAVAVACRKHAILNDKAIMKTPITIEDHQASPILVDPFHLLDFSLQTDGAIAFVVSSAERARDMRQRPVYIMGIGEGHYWTDEIPNKPDFIKTGHRAAAKRAFAMAGVTHKDIDAVEVYDGFTFHVLGFLEDMGFCGIGESGPFVEGGRIELGGELPLNTHGGNLSQAHVVGLNHTSEAVKQLRGQAGKAQVPNAEIILVNNEGRVGSGGVAILRR